MIVTWHVFHELISEQAPAAPSQEALLHAFLLLIKSLLVSGVPTPQLATRAGSRRRTTMLNIIVRVSCAGWHCRCLVDSYFPVTDMEEAA